LFFVQGSLKIAILSLVVLGLGQVAVSLLCGHFTTKTTGLSFFV
jgi:hypothetical protein